MNVKHAVLEKRRVCLATPLRINKGGEKKQKTMEAGRQRNEKIIQIAGNIFISLSLSDIYA